MLEQGGKVVAYASRALSKAEHQYSVIQRECLAAVYGMKQFRHYLLGRSFKLVTDHAPLQWLSAQKMEGLLCRWSLALQEYDFTITYRKGSLNANADALSRYTQSYSTMHIFCRGGGGGGGDARYIHIHTSVCHTTSGLRRAGNLVRISSTDDAAVSTNSRRWLKVSSINSSSADMRGLSFFSSWSRAFISLVSSSLL